MRLAEFPVCIAAFWGRLANAVDSSMKTKPLEGFTRYMCFYKMHICATCSKQERTFLLRTYCDSLQLPSENVRDECVGGEARCGSWPLQAQSTRSS